MYPMEEGSPVLQTQVCKRTINPVYHEIFTFSVREQTLQGGKLVVQVRHGFWFFFNYRPQTKLRDGSVFTGICLSTGGVHPGYTPWMHPTPMDAPPGHTPTNRYTAPPVNAPLYAPFGCTRGSVSFKIQVFRWISKGIKWKKWLTDMCCR